MEYASKVHVGREKCQEDERTRKRNTPLVPTLVNAANDGCEDSGDLGDEHLDINAVARIEVEPSGVWESAAALLRCEPGNGGELNSKNSFE